VRGQPFREEGEGGREGEVGREAEGVFQATGPTLDVVFMGADVKD